MGIPTGEHGVGAGMGGSKVIPRSVGKEDTDPVSSDALLLESGKKRLCRERLPTSPTFLGPGDHECCEDSGECLMHRNAQLGVEDDIMITSCPPANTMPGCVAN